jgi:glycosyltransferase involved in cell wall biosynthesis
MTEAKPERIAVIHEWFESLAGSEQVVEQMLQLYPAASVYALVNFMSSEAASILATRKIHTSFIQNLPLSRKMFRLYLPLMPLAIEQFNLSSYDIVISSNHAVAKGVITGPDQLHISYMHTPMRYAWELQHQYLVNGNKDAGLRKWLACWLLHRMRLWDATSANRVDVFIANSQYIAGRIFKFYKRSARVIYPPVDVSRFEVGEIKDDFYVTISRLVPYKRVDLIVRAFSDMPAKRLVVVGDGPDRDRIEHMAGPNVEFVGHQPFPALREYLQRAKAFIFMALEDFGIAPVEAQACGTPVIAFARGGLSETVCDTPSNSPTGILFHSQEPQSLSDAVEYFEAHQSSFDPWACRLNAERFGADRFRAEFAGYVEDCWARFKNNVSLAPAQYCNT